jgi:copper transport protein
MLLRKILRWSILFFCLALLTAQPALAHGYIVRSIPQDRAQLERAPTRLQYWFSENLEPEFSSITVRNQAGEVVAMGGIAEGNESAMTARLPVDLPDGAYTVELRLAFASDGHVVTEGEVFFVGEASSEVSDDESGYQVVPLEVAWRALVSGSMALLLGVFALYSLVLLPAWGNRDYPAGFLPPRVMNFLNWLVIAALVAAGLSSLLSLVQQTMVFFNADVGQVMGQGLWQVVRIGTRFGDVWNVRMAALILVAVLHGVGMYMSKRQPELVAPTWAANAWVIALAISVSSIASHAAGSLILPWAAIIVDWAHRLAVSLWVGGLAALVLVLPVALKPLEGDARRMALLAALRRFSRLALVSAAVVVASGIYSATNWFYKPDDLATPYGLALGLKILLVLGLLAVAAGHHIALRPERYQRFHGMIARVNTFLPTLRLELLIAALVLIAAGLLGASQVPAPEFVSAPPPSASQTVGDVDVTVTITPGGPGINTYDTQLIRDGQPLEDVPVRVQMVYPSMDKRGAWQPAESADAGLYVSAGDEIDRAGEWWALVEFGGENPERAAFPLTISAEASVLPARPPSVINLVALALVMIALGWAAYPLLMKYAEQFELTPANLVIAVLAIIGMVITLIGSWVLIQQNEANYLAQLNPPPQIINPILPDALSLARGQDLYGEHCTAWEESPRVLRELSERLSRTRDEELFDMTRDGWRGLPACTGELSDDQRWDVVNYLRTLERADS